MDSSIALYISSTSRSRSRYSECKLLVALLAGGRAPAAGARGPLTGREARAPRVDPPLRDCAPMHVHPSPRALTRHTDMYH